MDLSLKLAPRSQLAAHVAVRPDGITVQMAVEVKIAANWGEAK